MSTELNLDAERVRFEAWAKDHLGQGYPLTMDEGTYEHPVTRWAFKAWQAARRTAPVSAPLDQQQQVKVAPPFAAPASQHDARDPNWLLSTMDGKDWADEFCRLNNAADHGMMLAWFCNAIMVGYDTGRRHEAEEQSSMAGAKKGGA